jgi:hypothetical protein
MSRRYISWYGQNTSKCADIELRSRLRAAWEPVKNGLWNRRRTPRHPYMLYRLYLRTRSRESQQRFLSEVADRFRRYGKRFEDWAANLWLSDIAIRQMHLEWKSYDPHPESRRKRKSQRWDHRPSRLCCQTQQERWNIHGRLPTGQSQPHHPSPARFSSPPWGTKSTCSRGEFSENHGWDHGWRNSDLCR